MKKRYISIKSIQSTRQTGIDRHKYRVHALSKNVNPGKVEGTEMAHTSANAEHFSALAVKAKRHHSYQLEFSVGSIS